MTWTAFAFLAMFFCTTCNFSNWQVSGSKDSPPRKTILKNEEIVFLSLIFLSVFAYLFWFWRFVCCFTFLRLSKWWVSGGGVWRLLYGLKLTISPARPPNDKPDDDDLDFCIHHVDLPVCPFVRSLEFIGADWFRKGCCVMLLTEILNLASVHTQKCPFLPGCNYAASTLIIFLGCHRRSESPKLFFLYHFFVPKASRNAMKHMILSFEMKGDAISDHFLMLWFSGYCRFSDLRRGV